MAFQIKDFASISASMVNWMKSTTKKITDFNIGSVVRTMVEAVAIEIDELYQQMFIGLKEAIPVSTYNSFDFSRIAATPTSGMVRVTVPSAAVVTLIPDGTIFKLEDGARTYASVGDVSIAPGSTFADVFVSATAPGAAGNILSGQSFELSPAVAGMVSATNIVAMQNGSDLETDGQRKLRFIEFIASLARGTVRAIEYGLKLTIRRDAMGNEIERVVTTAIIEPYVLDPINQPISLVHCYIHNGTGNTSSALVDLARQVVYGYTDANGVAIPGWKAAGVHVEVFAAAEEAVSFRSQVVLLPGYNMDVIWPLILESIYGYLISLPIGKPAIKAEIVSLAMAIDGVFNYTPTQADVNSNAIVPLPDVVPAANVKLMPGALTRIN